ncbi:hypothetical protein [Xanthomonas arboricola]|uniref:hypothetical protein n=1 Tax=Xanthomonas arboricola TaxID=56448 RepID=UPI000B2AE1F5|nr:hypothetical protein [Xanthomonas arboricola]
MTSSPSDPIATALSQSPVRIVLGNAVHWLRPSSVLRIEIEVRGNDPEYLNIWLSDGKKLWLSCNGMQMAEANSTADKLANKLWQVRPQEAPHGWSSAEA